MKTVKLGGSLCQALTASEAVLEGHGRLLLVDALAWVETNPAPPPQHSGPTLVKTVFDMLATRSG